MNLVFLGPPGSGKGTQSALLSQKLKIPNISTGDILRKELSDSTTIGLLAKSYMDSGQLVPDQVVVDIVKKRIAQEDCAQGFILDGFPRNLAQGQILTSMLEDLQKKIDLVFDVEVPDEVIIKRISGRFSCKNCNTVYNRFFSLPKKENVCDKCESSDFVSREDDNEATVKDRLNVYRNSSKDLVDFYRKKDLLYSVDGLKNVGSVSVKINEAVDLVSKK